MIKPTLVPTIVKTSILKILESGNRIDGRKFDEYREVKVETGVLERAEGSAMVWIGNTRVATGVKIGTGEPYPDSPDQGVLISNAELVPMASPEFQPGPPDENTVELARVIDRGIRESQCIDFSKLCITPKEEVRIVYIDSYVLDYSGNFMDTAVLAATAALHNAKIPDAGKLPVSKKPIANTFVKIGPHIVLDPCLEEDKVLDAKLTITIEDLGNVCAMQKAGSGTFKPEEIMECIKTAQKKTKELRKLLK